MIDSILVINAGSSSIKFAVYELDNIEQLPILAGKFSGIGRKPELKIKDRQGKLIELGPRAIFGLEASHEQLTQYLLDWLNLQEQTFQIVAVGHRVVHGGQLFCEATKVTADVIQSLDALCSLAPLHQPHNLSAIKAVDDSKHDLVQVVCFDTGFHRSQNKLAQMFAIPYKYAEEGIIRYGFHGLSYEYIASCLPQYLGDLSEGRVIVAHLGNGASMCAIKQRKSVATSMGFTALDGLMMGQRSGSLDPGVVLHFMQHYKMTAEEVQQMLYHESGLLGVSGISNNMQVLQESTHKRAKLAIDLFCYTAARELASLVTDLNGLDAIVFTAGIGENSAMVRQGICSHLKWLGVQLDEELNDQNHTYISAVNARIEVCIIPTNEELVIAQQTKALINS
jgi:acetate kinase